MSKYVLQPENVLPYILGGNGILTVKGARQTFAYRFSKPEDKPYPIFVSVLSGPDNTSDYQYIGHIARTSIGLDLCAGKKGKPMADSFIALGWMLPKLWDEYYAALRSVQFWHSGTCAVCGRTLTTPESLETGIGPICRSQL